MHAQPLRFTDLGLSAALQRGLADMGVTQPTAIQQQSIAMAQQRRDVWAAAPTGSGKTLAYALPVVQQRAARPAQGGYKRPVRALVLVPTRELAVQARRARPLRWCRPRTANTGSSCANA